MNTQIIKEAVLTAPTFNGSDEEVAQATQGWASLISSLSYSTSSNCSAENKKAMLSALSCYVQCKIDEINNVTQPPVVATKAPEFSFVPDAPIAAATTPTSADCDSYADVGTEVAFASYAESKKPVVKESVNPILKRMRELAGIPHETNRV
jgi:hypothetical protein